MRVGFNLAEGLARLGRDRPEALALRAGGAELSYGALASHAARLGGRLSACSASRRVGILGTRSLDSYIGVLGACWAGSAYVPLNLKWPPERLIALLEQLQLDALITDGNGARL